VPGTEVEIRDADPETGRFTVRRDGDELELGERAASGLFVRSA